MTLGAGESQGTIQVRNSGGLPLSFTATTAEGPLVVSPTTGTLDPGASAAITVTLDRAAAPEGSFRRVVAFAAAEAGGLGVTVTAEVEHPPVVTDLAADPAALTTGGCGSQRSTVTAVVSDESALQSVSVVWGQTGGGAPEIVEMSRSAARPTSAPWGRRRGQASCGGRSWPTTPAATRPPPRSRRSPCRTANRGAEPATHC